MYKGSKVRIKEASFEGFRNRIGIVILVAPGIGGTSVYRVRIGDMILPEWFCEDQLEDLHRPYTTLLFDYEGTLSDTSMGRMRSLDHALEKAGILHDTIEDLRPYVGLSPYHVFHDVFHLPAEEARMAVQLSESFFSDHGLFDQTLWPGVKDMLATLHREGFCIVVLSQQPQKDLEFSIDMQGIKEYVDYPVGIETYESIRSMSQLMDGALRRLAHEGERKPFVLVGDQQTDMAAAVNNHIDSIAVTWGFGTPQELADANPTKVAADIDGLMRILYAQDC